VFEVVMFVASCTAAGVAGVSCGGWPADAEEPLRKGGGSAISSRAPQAIEQTPFSRSTKIRRENEEEKLRGQEAERGEGMTMASKEEQLFPRYSLAGEGDKGLALLGQTGEVSGS